MSSPLRPLEVDQFSALLSRATGLRLEADKRERLASLLATRVLLHSCPSVEHYLSNIAERDEEISKVIEQLTVTETYFFRDQGQFDALRALVSQLTRDESRPLTMISAACSSGEEPYSMAMTVLQALPQIRNRFIQIDAFDLNPRVLKIAAAAEYRSWSMRSTPEDVIARFFTQERNRFLVNPNVVKMVRFRTDNLTRPRGMLAPPSSVDIIFCRNALMYLHADAVQKIVANFARVLRPGGYLFLGHAENLRGVSRDFDLRHDFGTFFYERRAVLTEDQFFSPTVPTERTDRSKPSERPRAAEHSRPSERPKQSVYLSSTDRSRPSERPQAPTSEPRTKAELTLRGPTEKADPSKNTDPSALAALATEGESNWYREVVRSTERITALFQVSGARERAQRQLPEPDPRPDPAERDALRLTAARELMQKERFHDALQQMSPTANPGENPEEDLLRAMLLVGMGRFVEARELCDGTLHADNLNPGAHYIRSLCEESLANFEASALESQAAVYLDENFAMPHLQLGRLARRSRDYAKARVELELALRLLHKEDPARILLFGGGFGRSSLIRVCQMELAACERAS